MGIENGMQPQDLEQANNENGNQIELKGKEANELFLKMKSDLDEIMKLYAEAEENGHKPNIRILDNLSEKIKELSRQINSDLNKMKSGAETWEWNKPKE